MLPEVKNAWVKIMSDVTQCAILHLSVIEYTNIHQHAKVYCLV